MRNTIVFIIRLLVCALLAGGLAGCSPERPPGEWIETMEPGDTFDFGGCLEPRRNAGLFFCKKMMI